MKKMLDQKGRYFRFGLLLVVLGLIAQAGWQVRSGQQGSQVAESAFTPRISSVSGAPSSSDSQPGVTAPPFEVGRSLINDVSPPLRDINPIPAAPWTQVREMPERDPLSTTEPAPPVDDPAVQKEFSPGSDSPMAMPAAIQNFNGL